MARSCRRRRWRSGDTRCAVAPPAWCRFARTESHQPGHAASDRWRHRSTDAVARAQVDEDGNERAGIRLPDIAVPLATYTGWNFRKPDVGSPSELFPLLGSSIFFPATRAAREAAKDPRRSIEERYRSQEDYLAKVEQAADALVKAGYLLVDDEPRILQRASDQWEIAVSR